MVGQVRGIQLYPLPVLIYNMANPTINVIIAEIKKDISYLFERTKGIEVDGKNYATKEELKPIKQFVYGVIMLVLTTVIAAILSQVIK